jgi:peroxiredoxin Q/BCP
MSLRVGLQSPEFDVAGSDGRSYSDVILKGRAYVVTFYPKDETAGCIAQVCAMRDVWEDFRGMDIPVFGVSRDSIEDHKSFVAKRKLPYVLLTDATGAMHKAFDVGRMFGVTNRVSYLVDRDGKIAEVYASNMRPEAHAAKMVEAARALR